MGDSRIIVAIFHPATEAAFHPSNHFKPAFLHIREINLYQNAFNMHNTGIKCSCVILQICFNLELQADCPALGNRNYSLQIRI